MAHTNRITRIAQAAAAVFIASAFLGGCAAQAARDDGGDAEILAESTTALHGSTDENRTYYTYRQDYRRCMYPFCGGAWVSRVNRARMECADGSRAEECYVSDLDWGALALDGDTESLVRRTDGVLLRGTITGRVIDDFGTFGTFAASEAWLPASDAGPSGRVWRMEDNGIRCVTEPCYSLDGSVLNRRRRADFASLDLSGAGAADDVVASGHSALSHDGGLLVAGFPDWSWSDSGGWVRSFWASQFYTRAVAVTPECVISGCSSQICGDETVITTCEWREEYACYRSATCELQADGVCGWTATEELSQCIDDAAVQVCGTRGALPCDPGEYCDYPLAASCGWADAGGTCQPQPEVCTREYRPVCGCDGRSYDNVCMANAHGISVLEDGLCCTAGSYEADSSEIEGHWTGTGAWEVQWNFRADGTFTKSDLVAPCPEGVVCFWSGIVTNHGTYRPDGTELELVYLAADNSFGVTTPVALSVATTCEHLVLSEATSDGTIEYLILD